MLLYAANGIFRGLQKVQVTLWAAIAGAIPEHCLDFYASLRRTYGDTRVGYRYRHCPMGYGTGPHPRQLSELPAAIISASCPRRRPCQKHFNARLCSSALALRIAMVSTVAAAASMGATFSWPPGGEFSRWNLPRPPGCGAIARQAQAPLWGPGISGRCGYRHVSLHTVRAELGIIVGLVLQLWGYRGRAFQPGPARYSI